MARTIATNTAEKLLHVAAGAPVVTVLVVLAGMVVTALLVGGLLGCTFVQDGSSRPEAASGDTAGADAAASAQSGAATATVAASGAAAPETSGSIETHGVLGNFSAKTLQRADFTQDDIAAKDVTVINFWSTTCPLCVNEMPLIAALAKRLPDNVQIITVCFDGLSSNERALEVVQRAGFDGVTLMQASDGMAVLANRVRYTPTTVFVTADGTVVGDVVVGAPTDLEAVYVAGINQALSWQGKPAATLADAEG